MARKGKAKSLEVKAHPSCIVESARYLLRGSLLSSSLFLLHFLVLHQSNTFRSLRKDGRRDSANNKYKPRREFANELRLIILTILTE